MTLKTLTILTPTFNRGTTLIKLYESLVNQKNKNFNWLIIDDGSTDNTSEIVEKFDNANFKIEYHFKENGGKHTAHNYGLNFIDTDLTMVVDSDDYLTTHAVEQIIKEWSSVKDRGLSGLSFLKADNNGLISGKKYPQKRKIDNFIDMRINRNDISEKAEVWVTSILKEYLFPVFEGEKYVPEGAIWQLIGKKYDMLFINEVIYIYEYKKDGLTNTGRKLRLDNPRGQIFAANIGMTNHYNYIPKLKRVLLFSCYGFFAKTRISKMYNISNSKTLYVLMLPLGYLLYLYWGKKYK